MRLSGLHDSRCVTSVNDLIHKQKRNNSGRLAVDAVPLRATSRRPFCDTGSVHSDAEVYEAAQCHVA